MGKTIERVARDRGHEVVLVVDENNRAICTDDQLKQADVAIELQPRPWQSIIIIGVSVIMFRWYPVRRDGWKDGAK